MARARAPAAAAGARREVVRTAGLELHDDPGHHRHLLFEENNMRVRDTVYKRPDGWMRVDLAQSRGLGTHRAGLRNQRPRDINMGMHGPDGATFTPRCRRREPDVGRQLAEAVGLSPGT